MEDCRIETLKPLPDTAANLISEFGSRYREDSPEVIEFLKAAGVEEGK